MTFSFFFDFLRIHHSIAAHLLCYFNCRIYPRSEGKATHLTPLFSHSSLNIFTTSFPGKPFPSKSATHFRVSSLNFSNQHSVSLEGVKLHTIVRDYRKLYIKEIEQKVTNTHNHHHRGIACFAIIPPTDLFVGHPFISRYCYDIR